MTVALRLLADIFEFGLVGPRRQRAVEAGLAERSEESSDVLAARHESLTGFAVPPYAGVFMDSTGQVGRDSEERVRRWLGGRDQRSDPEHLAAQCRALAMLEFEDNPFARELAGTMMAAWIPAWAHAARREGFPQYADCADVVLELAGRVCEPTVGKWLPEALSEPGDQTGLQGACTFLTSHASTGVYLGRQTVRRLARESGLPCGFGGRALMLRNLLLAASQYEAIDRVVASLQSEADYCRAAWKERGGAWSGFWTERTQGFERTLSQLVEMAAKGASGNSPEA